MIHGLKDLSEQRIKNILEVYDKKAMTYQKLWGAAKVVLT